MKKFFTFFLFSFSALSFSQNIQFADPNLKNLLINSQSIISDTDGDGIADNIADSDGNGEISMIEGNQIITLSLNDINLVLGSFADINSFSNLRNLLISGFNNINSINLSNLSLLNNLNISQTGISQIDITNNLELTQLQMHGGSQRLQVIFGLNDELISINSSNIEIQNLNLSLNTSLNFFYLFDFISTNSDLNLSNLNNITTYLLRSGSGVNNLILNDNNRLREIEVNNVDIQQFSSNNNGSTVAPGEVRFINCSSLSNIDFNQTVLRKLIIDNSLTGTQLDFSPYNIEEIEFFNTDLQHITLPNLRNFVGFGPHHTINFYNINQLPQINFNALKEYHIGIYDSPNLTELNLGNIPLFRTEIFNNLNLENIFINHPIEIFPNSAFGYHIDVKDSPSLKYVCTTTNAVASANFVINDPMSNNGTNNGVEVTINDYCSFKPEGNFNEIEGSISIDNDNNGCDPTDPIFSNFNFTATDGTTTGTISSNQSGAYYVPVADGQHTITPNPENPSYWNFSPANVVVNFPTQTSPFTQDFCVTANGTIEDLEVIVIPLEQARPGFDTDYKVVVKNKGNQTSSGSVTLDFEEDFMTLLSSTPTAAMPATNQLSWSVSNLQPFQMEEYEFTMTLNTPTQATNPLNGGDILTFTGTVTGTGTDAMPADNVMVFDQKVVNSYDPNDKTCLEGKTIDPSDVGEYVHYLIRFENTGTASAVNIVVKDEIDLTQFDITTLIPLGGSHDYYTRIREGNVVEFIHENINLDFNDATNDGYVLFKIKTLNTLVAGDTFDNTAEIYFDFNFPIVTNTETVTIMTTASIGETTDTSISIYPNPARDFINITSTNVLKSATLIDVNGRTLSQTNFTGNTTEQRISMENLTSGVYFVTIQSEVGQKVEKVLLE